MLYIKANYVKDASALFDIR